MTGRPINGQRGRIESSRVLTVSELAYRRLRLAAADRGTTISKLIDEALDREEQRAN